LLVNEKTLILDTFRFERVGDLGIEVLGPVVRNICGLVTAAERCGDCYCEY
jgi:hypothetical protein